jgi:O-antigen ligase
MSGLIDLDRRYAAIRNTLLGILCLAVVVYGVVRISSSVEPERLTRTTPATSVAACISTYQSIVAPPPASVTALTELDAFCYNMIAKQLRIEEQIARDDAFVLQKFENLVLLWMVVAITLSGVGLAGLQLYASYQLALAGHGKFMADGATDLSYSDKSVAIKSSVVGLIILVISFAFFMVFVRDLHPIRTIEMVAPVLPSPAASAGPYQSGPMVPVLPPAGSAGPRAD